MVMAMRKLDMDEVMKSLDWDRMLGCEWPYLVDGKEALSNLVRLFYAESPGEARKLEWRCDNRFSVQGALYESAVSAMEVINELIHMASDDAVGGVLGLMQDMCNYMDFEKLTPLQERVAEEVVRLFGFFCHLLKCRSAGYDDYVILLMSYCVEYKPELGERARFAFQHYRQHHPDSECLELLGKIEESLGM